MFYKGLTKKNGLPPTKIAEDIIEKYLESQERPFALNDIVQNLHNQVSKPNALKALEALVDSDRIMSRTFGKIIIYSRHDKEINFEEEIQKKVDAGEYTHENLLHLREEFFEMESDKTQAKKNLDEIMSTPSNDIMVTEIERLKEELSQKREKLDSLKSSWNPESEKKEKDLNERYSSIIKEIKMRRKIVKTLVTIIRDQVRPKNLGDFLEEVGFEAEPVSKI